MPVTPTVPSAPEYFRQDIQGLRGIAVLLVVIYHTGIALPGGYIGVDIFFVISGFVITQLLIREIESTGQVHLGNFFSRRIYRLLPALFFLLTSTMLIALFVFSPIGIQTTDGRLTGEIQEVTQTARYSALFSTNAYFFFQDNYWALADNPLRHLWSLAVEEQFYIVFPLLFLLSIKARVQIKSKKFVQILIFIAGFSFCGSYLLSHGFRVGPLPTRFAFFGTPWRIWEFIAGAYFALRPSAFKTLTSPARSWIVFISALSILVPALRLNSFTPFPGLVALFPVFGTALILHLGYENSACVKILSSKPLVKLGDISYGWYLWHWPVIVFANRLYPQSQVLAPIFAVSISLVIAYVSLKIIENPIRRQKRFYNKKTIITAFVCTLGPFLLSIPIELVANTGMGLKESSLNSSQTQNYASKNDCGFSWIELDVSDFCKPLSRQKRSERLVLLVGDSSANSASDGAYKAAQELDLQFAVYYADSCPFIARPSENGRACSDFLKFLNSEIERLEPEILIISNMSDRYVSYGTQRGIVIRDKEGNQPWNYQDALKVWEGNLRDVLTALPIEQKTLVLTQPPFSKFLNPSLINPDASQQLTPLSFSNSRNLITEREMSVISGFTSVKAVDTISAFCDGKLCRQFDSGNYLYSDDRHLNYFGSLLLKSAIQKAIIQILEGE